MSDCNICCEKYNKTNHKRIVCPYCESVICRTCAMAYYTNNTNDMHCMSCKHGWLDEFIQNSFTKIAYNTVYKKNQLHIMLEQEKSLLPATQNAACLLYTSPSPRD